jgi:hypothetical protein
VVDVTAYYDTEDVAATDDDIDAEADTNPDDGSDVAIELNGRAFKILCHINLNIQHTV